MAVNEVRGPIVQTECSCQGRNSECVLCGGTGSIPQRSCMRCGGTGKEGPVRCLDCRGEGWRDVELL